MIKTQINWRHVPFNNIFYLAMNALQMMGGVTVLALCGSDLSEEASVHKGRSIFSMITAILSILTALSLATEIFLTVPSRLWLVIVFLWQWTIVSMWSVSAGLMGAVYLHGFGKARMKASTGFVYLNLALWMLLSIVGTISCCTSGRKKKRSGSEDGEGK